VRRRFALTSAHFVVDALSIFGSVIWPCVPVAVPVEHQATAYGVMTSFQNAGQFVVPLVLQYVYRQTHSYIPCEGFFIVMSCLCAVVAGVIWVMDESWNNAILRLPDTAEDEADTEGEQQATGGGGAGSAMLYGSTADYDKLGGSNGMTGKRSSSNGSGTGYGGVEYGAQRGNSDSLAGSTSRGPGSRRSSHAPPANSNSAHCSSANSSLSSGSAMCEYMAHAELGIAGADEEVASGLLNESKFARMRAYSMPESRPSVSHSLCGLSEEGSHPSFRSVGTGAGSQTLSQCTGSTSPGTTPLRPITLIPIPRIVHYSQEHYERANAFQFPREDPLALRRQISERDRVVAPSAGWLGIAQSVPCSRTQIEQYQLYRQTQIMAHNQMAQAEQQQHLVLGPSRSSRWAIF
jgi:hypothetical protein